MSIDTTNLVEQIIALKRRIHKQCPNLKTQFKELEAVLSKEIDSIQVTKEKGDSIIPEINFSDIVNNHVNDSTIRAVKRRGCTIVRNVFSDNQASRWYEELESYLETNGFYYQKDPELDNYFSDLKADKPQICAIYWSKAQVNARQSPNLVKVRSFLNRLWNYQENEKLHFDPDRECSYVDRVRLRRPGDTTLGLSPHIDGGSVERWLGENYQKVYHSLFSSNWQGFNPFNGAYRPEVEGIDSPAVCRAFRTWQGWTALTKQGPGDGTLQLIPTTLGISYVMLRPFQDDVPEEILCGATEGRAQAITDVWHHPLLRGLISIPMVYPGDTVWWHPDLIHSVEQKHSGSGVSSVLYIGSTPRCERNISYLERQKQSFIEGRSAPDFAPEDFEVNYPNRASMADLTELGKQQMGFLSKVGS
ncbi:MAG: DUF1479 domain-containing protein [SAR324 cluster bacterium]|nr:DUF1479 domain-containing protein [SAR324 cluster bacterium]